MILSRATARTFWGDEDPIGRTVRRVADGKDFTVVGIVGDVRSTTLNRESPALYYSSGSRTWPLMDVVVRTQSDPASVMATVRQKIRALDPELPLSNIRPMTRVGLDERGAAPPQRDAARRLRVRGAAGRRDRHLRRARLFRLAADEGARPAHGARRGPRRCPAVDCPRGHDRRDRRHHRRDSRSRRDQPDAVGARVRRLCLGSQRPTCGVSGTLAMVALVSCVVPAVRASRVDPMEALRLD